MYALRVINRTTSALVCRTWVLSRDGDAVLAYPLLFEVAPLCTNTTEIPVWPSDFASFDRAIAEVAGDGVHCIVEAAAPARRGSPRSRAAFAVVSLVAVMSALLAIAAVRVALPRIAALAVPPETLSGTTIAAQYGAFGVGRLTYSVTAPDGRLVQGGELAEHSGSIPIAIPATAGPGAYTLQMMMTGPLGRANETRVINALPAKGAGPAEIAEISVKPAVAEPGQRIDVAYAAAADDGYVRLVGTDGTIWQERPFSHTGQAQFVIPNVPSLRELRVVVRVRKGRSIAESMAGLVVWHAMSQNEAAAQIPGDANPSVQDANGTFAVLVSTVKSGHLIRVHILSPRNGMRIALTDAQSHELTAQDVGAEADIITLQAPSVTVPTRYTIVASFTDGFGQESLVAPVTIVP